MTTNVLIYTVATDINEERLFVKLDAVCVEGCVFHLLGTDKTNEPFVAWATAKLYSLGLVTTLLSMLQPCIDFVLPSYVKFHVLV